MTKPGLQEKDQEGWAFDFLVALSTGQGVPATLQDSLSSTQPHLLPGKSLALPALHHRLHLPEELGKVAVNAAIYG